jgi:hypothetical protein
MIPFFPETLLKNPPGEKRRKKRQERRERRKQKRLAQA